MTVNRNRNDVPEEEYHGGGEEGGEEGFDEQTEMQFDVEDENLHHANGNLRGGAQSSSGGRSGRRQSKKKRSSQSTRCNVM